MNKVRSMITLLLIILFVILIVPTLIVVPYISEGNSDKTQDAISNNIELKSDRVEEDASNDVETKSDSSLEIAVFRTQLDTIEDVSFEEYVVGVVAGEMPVKFESEALKAQSLAARTYIVRKMLSEDKSGIRKGSTISDDESHQVYKSKSDLRKAWGSDYDSNIKKITNAVKETEGEIIVYDNQPIDATYFSTSNGFTEDSEGYWSTEIPYLRSVESAWDKDSPEFLGQKTISITDFENKLGVTIGDSSVGKITSRTNGNSVDVIEIGDKSLSGEEVRSKLELRSTDFSLERKNDHIVITTKGYGHGVGMSQYGANSMAKEGKTYSDIVTYYYKDVEIVTNEQFLPKLMVKN